MAQRVWLLLIYLYRKAAAAATKWTNKHHQMGLSINNRCIDHIDRVYFCSHILGKVLLSASQKCVQTISWLYHQKAVFFSFQIYALQREMCSKLQRFPTIKLRNSRTYSLRCWRLMSHHIHIGVEKWIISHYWAYQKDNFRQTYNCFIKFSHIWNIDFPI